MRKSYIFVMIFLALAVGIALSTHNPDLLTNINSPASGSWLSSSFQVNTTDYARFGALSCFYHVAYNSTANNTWLFTKSWASRTCSALFTVDASDCPLEAQGIGRCAVYAFAVNGTLNNSNNVGEAFVVQYSMDYTAPEVSIQSPANTTLATTAINLNFTAGDASGIAQCTHELDNINVTLAGCANATLTAAEGSHVLRLFVNDTASRLNVSTVIFSVDVSGPFMVIQSPANATFNTSLISINYTAADPNGISQCTVELNGINTTLPACQNTTAAAAEGTNVLRVWANDTLGNLNASSVSFTAILPVQFAAPTPQNGTYAAAQVINATASISDLDRLVIVVNGTAAASSATSPVSYALGEGNYSFFAAANSTANATSTTETRNVIVDLTRPAVLNATPQAVELSQNASIFINVTDNFGIDRVIATVGSSSFTMQQAGSAFNAAIPSSVLNATGNFTVTFVANDTAGNVNSTVSIVITVVDTTAPAIALAAPANNTLTNLSVVSFSFTASDLAATGCVLAINNATAAVNASVVSGAVTTLAAAIAEGSNVWYVNCTDASGNLRQSAARNLTVDLTVPLLVNYTFVISNEAPAAADNVFISPANQDGIKDGVKINVTASETVNFTIRVLPGSFTAVDNNAISTVKPSSCYWLGTSAQCTGTNLSDGVYTVSVDMIDAAGNRNISSAKTITVDNTQPALNLTNPLNSSVINTTAVSLNFTATDASAIECTALVNNQSVNVSSCQNTTLSLSNGMYNLTLAATDAANNSIALTVSFMVNASGSLYGVVRDTSGSLVNATVQLRQGQSTVAAAQSNGTGDYNISALLGTYTFVVSKAGYVEVQQSVTLVENATSVNITLARTPAAPSSPPSGGGGTNGETGSGFPASEGAAPQPASRDTTVSLTERGVLISLPVVSGQKNVVVSSGSITSISITVASPSENSQLVIEKTEKPADVAAPEDVVYEYLEVTPENINNITGVVFRFKVGKTWLSESGIDERTVMLQRYSRGWNELKTERVTSDSGAVHYRAASPGFSLFAITGEKHTVPVTTTTVPARPVPATTTTVPGSLTGLVGAGDASIAAVLIAFAVLAAWWLLRKRKKN